MAKGQVKQKQATINQKNFEGMCFVQCTKEEICAILDVSDKTLTRWCIETYGVNFDGAYKRFSQGGKMSLRRNMFKQAEHNPSMAIWLSKQHLGMKDVVEVDTGEEEDKAREILVSIKKVANESNNDRIE